MWKTVTFKHLIHNYLGWTYLVCNYLGPNNGEGIRMYMDGNQMEFGDSTKTPSSNSQGNGRVVLGRLYTNTNAHYGNADMDEILLFNQSLTDDQISQLSHM